MHTQRYHYLSCRDILALMGLAIIVGLTTGVLVVAFFACLDSSNNWQQISNPPDKVVELLDYDYSFNRAYVRTTTEDIYTCSSSYKANGKGCVKVSYPSEYPPLNSCAGKIYPTPKPPGAVVSQLEVHPCIEDSWVQVNLVVLDDDSIWKWETIEGEIIFFGRIFLVGIGAVCGATLSLIGGIGILLLKRKRQWRTV